MFAHKALLPTHIYSDNVQNANGEGITMRLSNLLTPQSTTISNGHLRPHSNAVDGTQQVLSQGTSAKPLAQITTSPKEKRLKE